MIGQKYNSPCCAILIGAALSIMFGDLGPANVGQQESPITDVVFAPNGQSVAACSQEGLKIFSWPDLTLQKLVEVSFDNVHCLAFSPDGKQLAVGGGNPSEQGGVQIFAWPTCESQITLTGHNDSVQSVFWRDNRNLVSGSLDRSLRNWNLIGNKSDHTYRGHSRGVSDACMLDSGEMITVGHDQSVRLWNTKSGELLRSLSQHTKPVHALAICPVTLNRQIVATAAEDRTIRFWQPTIGRMMRYVRLESVPLDIVWIDATRMAASCTDGKVRMIDTDNVQVLHTKRGIQGWAYAIAKHPADGTFVVAGSRGQIQRLKFEPTE